MNDNDVLNNILLSDENENEIIVQKEDFVVEIQQTKIIENFNMFAFIINKFKKNKKKNNINLDNTLIIM